MMKKIAVLPVFILLLLADHSFSQKIDSTNTQKADSVKLPVTNAAKFPKVDSTKKEQYLKGGVTLTNKGISYIPNFSLGKPAIIFDLSMANKRLSFEPQLRFSLYGEPWSFLFPTRYKIKATGKFQISIGANPLMNFKSVTYLVNGVSTTDLVNRRYLGGELKPNYFITKNISIGATYLYFRGVSERTLKNTHFVSVNLNLLNIKLVWGFLTRINVQFYYLDQDGLGGYYFNPALTLSKKKFPLSVQTIMNTVLETDIPGSEKFIWNVSLLYAFNRTYTRK